MSWGLSQGFVQTMTSGLTLSPAFNLGRAFENVYLEIPTMVSGTDFYIQVANSAAGSFRRVMHPAINTSSVQINTFVIGSAATNRVVPIPNGQQYYKVEFSTFMSDTVTVLRIMVAD